VCLLLPSTYYKAVRVGEGDSGGHGYETTSTVSCLFHRFKPEAGPVATGFNRSGCNRKPVAAGSPCVLLNETLCVVVKGFYWHFSFILLEYLNLQALDEHGPATRTLFVFSNCSLYHLSQGPTGPTPPLRASSGQGSEAPTRAA
jgi:hypothetical protein